MFGMLDYRAHKLYWLLTLPMSLCFSLIATFGIAFVAYWLGVEFGTKYVWLCLIAIMSCPPITEPRMI
jgi:hypothetical protein